MLNAAHCALAALHANLSACTIALASNALLLSWPSEFATKDVTPVTSQRALATLACLALGIWIGFATRHLAYLYLTATMFGFALLIQLSAWLYWLGLDGAAFYGSLFLCLPAVGALATTAFTVWWWHCAASSLRRQHALDLMVTPTNVFLGSAYCVAVSLTLPFVGTLLHASCLALGFIGLGASAPLRRLGVCDGGTRRRRNLLLGAVAAATGISTIVAIRTLPFRVSHNTSHPIVHYEAGDKVDLKVTAVQGGFNVFVAGRLRFSTIDHARWAEALTRPALSRLACPGDALVLSMGEGLIERELLRDACITSITSVVRDGTLRKAAGRQPWWRTLTEDAWHSPRVVATEADPAHWIRSAPPNQSYDLIIVDLPDPEDFVNAKYYTRYFYRQLRGHMKARAILVVQATSALRSPNAFASIRATLEAAGLLTVPYRVALTTLGEWSFLLSQRDVIAPVARPEWLRGSALGSLETFALPPDSVPLGKGQVSRLDEPTVLDIFLNEEGEHAL